MLNPIAIQPSFQGINQADNQWAYDLINYAPIYCFNVILITKRRISKLADNNFSTFANLENQHLHL